MQSPPLKPSQAPSDAVLDDCASEPIRIPGSIQPAGALFAIDPADGRILQAAIGDPDILAGATDPLGRKLQDIVSPKAAALLEDFSHLPETGILHLGLARTSAAAHHVVAHRVDGTVVVEFERATVREPRSFDEVYPHVRQFLDNVQRTRTIDELTALAAREVRRITKLDRTLIYRFDEEWHGAVIAEDRNERLPSYLGLRFPASDIPAQARELYRINRLRLIADANYQPVPITPAINPLTGRPLDLSHAVLRSVSPVHLEYMRNMGTLASMSISLLHEDRLWGLISCHHRDSMRVPYHVRTACDFIGQVLSMQLAAREVAALADRRHMLRLVQNRLLAHMASADHYLDGLVNHPDDLLALTSAQGAAIIAGGACHMVGQTPPAAAISRLVEWLAAQRRQDIFATDHLAAQMPDGAAIGESASGLLAISISQLHDSYLLWFRPEVIRTIDWGGDPRKPVDAEGMRLHPRKSFDTWRETVRHRSLPWDAAEIGAAADLRIAIVDIVLRKAEETAALSERLISVNRELEAFSYSVSHDLRAPFRHIVGYAQLLKKTEGEHLSDRGQRYIDTIVESAVSAGTLVDDLLSYSQMGRATLTRIAVDMNELVAEVRNALVVEDGRHAIEWRIGDLPVVKADPMMLRLALQNLLENALKFSRHREPAVIEIGCAKADGEALFHVRDNGSGFDMRYVGKLFGVFQRLHRVEEFEGTGIGLANVKRVIERHGGRVWAEGTVDGGATFYFTLPRERMEATRTNNDGS